MEEDKMASEASLSLPMLQIFLSRCMTAIFVLSATPHLSLSVLRCLHLLYNFCFFIPILSPNFPFFPLNLSPLPPLLNLLDLPFKVKSSENSNKPQVFYVPWTKAELWDITKEIPKVTKDHTLSKGLLKNLTWLSNFPTYFCLFFLIYVCYFTCLLVTVKLNIGWNLPSENLLKEI